MVANKSIEALLNQFTNVLTLATTSDFPAAKGVFTNAINRYMAASQFIRNRPPGTKRLFNLDASDLAREAEFRSKITDVKNSLADGGVQRGPEHGGVPVELLRRQGWIAVLFSNGRWARLHLGHFS